MRYFQLEPYGLGTRDVESFISYLIRLSVAHGVTVPSFINHVKYTDLKRAQSFLTCSTTNAKPYTYASYSNPTQSVSDLVDVVGYAVDRNDLRCTTLLCLQNFYWRSNLHHKELHWCPECWKEDIENNTRPYLRLIWTFNEVTRCHKHRCLLISRCGMCNLEINVGAIRKNVFTCAECELSLIQSSKRMYRSSTELDLPYKDLLDLVETCSSERHMIYREDKIRSLLLSIVASSVESQLECEFWEKFCSLQGDWKSVIRGKRITFLQIRRFAHRLGISLPGLLEADPECWTSQLDPEWSWDLPSPIALKKRVGRRDYSDAEQLVLNYLKKLPATTNPSLKQVARDLELSVGGLEYNFPSLCAEIKFNYRRTLRSQRRELKFKADKAVADYMSNPFTNKSKKIAVKKLMEEHGFPKNMLREMLRVF